MNTASPAESIIERARTHFVLRQRFYATIALPMPLIEASERTHTMATDGVSLYYNSEYVASLNRDQMITLLAHEVLHPAKGHHTRRGKRDPELWNIAGDHEINLELTEQGFTPLPGWLCDHKYYGMAPESIYAALYKEREEERKQQPQQNGSQQDGNGNGQPEPGNGNGKPGPGPDQPGKAPGQPGGDPAPGEVWDYPGDKEEGEAKRKVLVTQAAQAAKIAGQLSGSLARLAKSETAHKVSWREALQEFAQEKINSDYSWTKPNRRFIADGLYLPGMDGSDLGMIALYVDTSGSIDLNSLNMLAAELTGLLEQFPGAELKVVYCDTQVQGAEEFDSNSTPVKLSAPGGGGTDFRPPFEWWEKSGNPDPACAIYFTDLHCSRYPNKPNYPVLWLTTPVHGRTPPFGQVVEMVD